MDIGRLFGLVLAGFLFLVLAMAGLIALLQAAISNLRQALLDGAATMWDASPFAAVVLVVLAFVGLPSAVGLAWAAAKNEAGV